MLFSKKQLFSLETTRFLSEKQLLYYALFSLPSLLIISVRLAGVFFGKSAVEGKITEQIEGLIGSESAELIQSIIINSSISTSSTIYVVIGVGVLIFGASGVFIQLQKALNGILGVRVADRGILHTVIDRAQAFGMVLILGFLMLLSLIINSLITAFSNLIGEYFPILSSGFIQLLNFLFSQAIITVLFASIFTILPDVSIKLFRISQLSTIWPFFETPVASPSRTWLSLK